MPSSEIRLDIFPVNVTVGERSWASVRLVVAGSEGYLFGKTGAGVSLLGQVDGLGSVDQPAYPLTVDTAEGAMTVDRSGGCGCGSVLRGMSVNLLLRKVAA